MPVYLYQFEDTGEVVERLQTVDVMLACKRSDGFFRIDGRKASRRIDIEHNGFKGTIGNWPMTSEAMACHPDQIKENSDFLAAQGIPTNFTSDGRPILESRSHRRKAMAAYGYHDRDGGYSDQT